MTVTDAGSLLAEASACRWSQLAFAKHWNELRQLHSIEDTELLNTFWSVAVLKHPIQSHPLSPDATSFEADLTFLDALELEIDRDLIASFVCFLIASGQLNPESTWNFIVDLGCLTKQEHSKVQIDLIGDLLKSLVISLLSLSGEISTSSSTLAQNSDLALISKFKLLLSIKSFMVSSICEFLAAHWDFNNPVTCLRLSKWLEVAGIFEKSGPLKVYCQLATPKALAIVDTWKRLQQLALSMAALERAAITIKENLISMSHRWIARSRSSPFSAHPSANKSSSSMTPSIGSHAEIAHVNEPEFCSLFCGAVDYLYALEFGSNINRFSSSEFMIPLLRSLCLSMTLLMTASNSETQLTAQITARYLPLLNHVASSMKVPLGTLFDLIEHSAKTFIQQPVQQQIPNQTKTKISVNNFNDTRPNYILRVFQSCRLSSLAKAMSISSYTGPFVSELITNAGRDMTRVEFEDFIAREMVKNLHIAPFLSRTEMTRLQLVLGERASKEENHLALGILAVVDLFKCYLLTGPGMGSPKDNPMMSEGAVGSFLENIVNKRIKNFAALIANTEDDDGADHDQDQSDGNLLDLETFMSTLPESLAEAVQIGQETASRLLFLLAKADTSRQVSVVRRLLLANPTLAFILWLLVDEKLRRKQVGLMKRQPSTSPNPPKRRRSGDLMQTAETLHAISEMIKSNVGALKPPFSGVYSVLITLSGQVRSLALINRPLGKNSQSVQQQDGGVSLALRQPSLLNHYCVLKEIALPDGSFRADESTVQRLGSLFHRILVSGVSASPSPVIGNPNFGTGVDTSESYRNFLAFSLPLIAGLDLEILQILFKSWFAKDGYLAQALLCGPENSANNGQLSFIVAAQVWNFSFFLILMTVSSCGSQNDEVKSILTKFFTDWHLGDDATKKDRFRFVAIEMFFAELMFFANINVCRLVASVLPYDFILNFVISTTPPASMSHYHKANHYHHHAHHQSQQLTTGFGNRLLQLKRRVIGRLFALDENNRFDEDFCIKAVCSLSPFESL